MDSLRAVLILRHTPDGERRGSGLRIGGHYVLTADHGVDGTDHRVIIGGQKYPATVHVRSQTLDADLAVLVAPGLPEMEPLGCVLLARGAVDKLTGCVALGFPLWKDKPDGGPRLAQVTGDVPTAEDL